MAIDQIEYCGGCEYYAECKARLGHGACPLEVDEDEGYVKDPISETETWSLSC